MPTNNITRMLISRKIQFTVFDLPSGEKLSALDTAKYLGVPASEIYKTIVVKCPRPVKNCLVVIPSTHEVDLKALATFLNIKKAHLPTQAEAEKMTGLVAGGITPLALINKGFQVILDQTAEKHDLIHVSGGEIGINIRLHVTSLVMLTHARMAAVGRPLDILTG